MGSVSLEPRPRLLGVLCGTDPPGSEGGSVELGGSPCQFSSPLCTWRPSEL